MAGLDDGRPATRLSPATRGLHAATEECTRSPRALPASPRSRESPRELETSPGSDRLATIAKAAHANQYFGERALLTNAARDANVVALRQLKLVSLQRRAKFRQVELDLPSTDCTLVARARLESSRRCGYESVEYQTFETALQ